MTSLLGFDIGSSFIKACLLNAETGSVTASASMPDQEMPIAAPRPGWAEQDPAMWWGNVLACSAKLRAEAPEAWANVAAIGISYQMHGLVAVDRQQHVLRPSIIWCDSRAVETGERIAQWIGTERCLNTMLNLPGNLTASKLRWVRENEPEIYARIDKFMLPGDYIAMKMTGEAATTPSGLSEGILWDFKNETLAEPMLAGCEISPKLLSKIVPAFSIQGQLTRQAADELHLPGGIPVAYRAGDQPNNAFSLNVLEPGEIAATAGTSGVVYGVIDQPNYDPQCRVNTFVHLSHSPESPRYGVLLCINGAGSLNRWLKHHVAANLSYETMNQLAAQTLVGADGLIILPFGNGAERVLGNRDIGCSVHNLNFNIHSQAHLFRAAQEGIVFALNYGVEIMRNMGLDLRCVRAGHTNMFLSPLFCEAFAATTGACVELLNTDGAQGAARGAGIGAGIYSGGSEAYVGLAPVSTVEPDSSLQPQYWDAYARWREALASRLPDEFPLQM